MSGGNLAGLAYVKLGCVVVIIIGVVVGIFLLGYYW